MRKYHLVTTAFLAAACSHAANQGAQGPAAASPAPVTPPVAQAAPAPVAPPAPPPPKPAEVYLAECRADITASKDLLAKVKAAPDHTVAAVLEPYNDLLIRLTNAEDKAGLLSEVHPDADMRKAADTCTEETAAFATDLNLDRQLYDTLKAVRLDSADADTHRFVEHSLRDFHRAGVDKDDATRAKLKELSAKQVSLGLDFDRNIREDVRKVRFDLAELAGLPDDYIAAHKAGPDGKIEITTDYPDYLPFRAYAKNDDARKRMYIEYQSRGYPKNDEILRQLLEARQEQAKLLGYDNWADYITEDKMIKSAKNAQDFIDKITKASDARARKDYAVLLKRKRKDDPRATMVAAYDSEYYKELVKREQYSFDAQSVRPYFDFKQSRDALLMITGKLFGVEYKAVPDAPRWHPDVDVYDVFQNGEKLGRIYLDLHPRENKYKHAAQFPLVTGAAGKQLPEGALVTNFPTGLMDHDDVVTMFHEFGHLMHHILGGKQHWVYFSGVATEQDFVEAPSQMLEEWAWDPSTLALFAKHNETHEIIPPALVKKMRAAHEFGKGLEVRTQMYYAALSLKLHEVDPAKADLLAIARELQAKYSLFPLVEGTHQYDNFTHLNGYSAMYYTYMWSQVIAKDLLSAFKKHGLLDEATAHKYRDTVLKAGGSKDAADLVKDFLGRPYSFDAYKHWLDG